MTTSRTTLTHMAVLPDGAAVPGTYSFTELEMRPCPNTCTGTLVRVTTMRGGLDTLHSEVYRTCEWCGL